MTTNEKPQIRANQIIEQIDIVLQRLDDEFTIDYATLIGALDDVKQRYEWQRRVVWAEAAATQRQKVTAGEQS